LISHPRECPTAEILAVKRIIARIFRKFVIKFLGIYSEPVAKMSSDAAKSQRGLRRMGTGLGGYELEIAQIEAELPADGKSIDRNKHMGLLKTVKGLARNTAGPWNCAQK
jgi:hypothetical protein